MRAFSVLERTLDRIFDDVEPCDGNKDCFSHETFSRLGRASMEVESLLSLQLLAAGETKSRPNMGDYRRLNGVLRLSEYTVRLDIWEGIGGEFKPFAPWGTPASSLPWWQQYNNSKHKRSTMFEEACLEAAVQATGAALVCLFSQVAGFALEASSSAFGYFNSDGWILGERLFSIQPPRWGDSEKYGFEMAPDHSKPLTLAAPSLDAIR